MKLTWNKYNTIDGTSVITTLDMHAAGEPLRIITGGMPELQGATILERRRYMQEHLDYIRRALMWEPRGHHDMYGCVVTPPVTPSADLGVLFLHNEGYSTMCGHGTIALVTALLETGVIPANGHHTPVNLDTPAGLVRATAHLDSSGHVEQVSFLNVPSFLYTRDVEIELPEYGRLNVDIAFGGTFYVFIAAEQVGLEVTPENTEHVPENPEHYSRNVCVFANGEVDRSPTGTGVSARLALHHAKGEIVDGQQILIESILGAASTFSGRIVGRAQVGPYEAIVPEVSGKAFITGLHEFIIDPRDTLGQGFLVS